MQQPGLSSVIVTTDYSGIIKESGGHRIQRIPPTERRGRVHTSTVTVSIIPVTELQVATDTINKDDLVVTWFSGTGAGGQLRNKHQNSCRMLHKPSALVVTSQNRKREQSYKEALLSLTKQLELLDKTNKQQDLSYLRKNLTGSGMRADKIRTYRFQDNSIRDHISGKSNKLDYILQGYFDLLH